ncbi:MAG: AraC family transcriptional regulator [Daejeonella sp.]|uniref:helix-turn-helix domain-containing protein n=1 Tax=Daejeonella sp. TaxID=2805397 RepID=UPI003C76CC4D
MLELHIKNMVCNRCITAVRNELLASGLHPVVVEMGVVQLEEEELDEESRIKLGARLTDLGFELLDNNRTRMIGQIKTLVIEKVHHSDDLDDKVNWSKLISDQLFHDYNYLSTLFSSVEGITLEQYIIRQKIEKVKELLFYDEFNLSEIAVKLGYSSIAHLSAQFKKITGQTPSQFKKTRAIDMKRNSLDQI